MLVNYNGKDVKLPDFLIVGAAKSGTTSLHYYLKQHPQVFMPKVKELRFFRKWDVSLYFTYVPNGFYWSTNTFP